ncbi:hypothetical protein Dda_7801 [Drechslerella dactyloides]|uniref:Uncharacterized protein n=1 Tax=Drechslerella dactyloides TaxID=74499 RepID=A0AAD6IR79_DREDA|nr:hypothetical protein Dda_7801 [Drechslerella dactyloides]
MKRAIRAGKLVGLAKHRREDAKHTIAWRVGVDTPHQRYVAIGIVPTGGHGMPTVADLRREVAGRPLGSGTTAALSGSFGNMLNNISNLHTQDQIVDMAAPFFPTSTDRGMAALTQFVFGVINSWDDIKKVLVDKGVEFLIKGIDKAWQAVKNAATEFWNWLSVNWNLVIEIAMTLVGSVVGGMAGGFAGTIAGAEVGLLVGGPVGAVVGAGVGSLLASFGGATIGGEIGGAIGRAMR